MQQPAFVTQARLSLCSKPSSDSTCVGALGSDVKAGRNHRVPTVSDEHQARQGGSSKEGKGREGADTFEPSTDHKGTSPAGLQCDT